MLGDLVAAAADGLQPSLARGLLIAVASALTRVLLNGGPQRCVHRSDWRHFGRLGAIDTSRSTFPGHGSALQ